MSARGFANWAVKVFAGDTPIVKMAVDGCFNLADKRAASKQEAEDQAILDTVRFVSAQLKSHFGASQGKILLQEVLKISPEDISPEDFDQLLKTIIEKQLRTPAGRVQIREFFTDSSLQATVKDSTSPPPSFTDSLPRAFASEPVPQVPKDAIYCAACGNACNRDAQFCRKCGARFGTAQMPVVSTPVPTATHYGQPASTNAVVPLQSPVRSGSIMRKVFVGFGIAAAALIALVIGLVLLAVLIPSKSSTSASASTDVPSIPVAATAPEVDSRSAGGTADAQLETIAAPAGVETPWSTYLGDSAQYGLDGVAANEGWFKLRKVGILEYALKLGRMHGQTLVTFNTEPAAAKLTDNVLSFTESDNGCKWTITFVESKATVIASSECNTVGEALSGSYSRN
jgi:hypothetical protein